MYAKLKRIQDEETGYAFENKEMKGYTKQIYETLEYQQYQTSAEKPQNVAVVAAPPSDHLPPKLKIGASKKATRPSQLTKQGSSYLLLKDGKTATPQRQGSHFKLVESGSRSKSTLHGKKK